MVNQVHKKIIGKIFMLLFTLVILFTSFGNSFPQEEVSASLSSSEIKKQIQALESKLQKSRNEQAELKKLINSTANQAADLERQIQTLDAETTLISEQLITIEQISFEWQNQQALKEEEVIRLEVEEKKEKERFDRMLQMSYEYGNDSYMELIFGAESFGDFLARLDLISYHLNHNEKVLKALAENQEKLKNSRLDYEESSLRLVELYNTQQALKEEYEQKIEAANQKKDALLATMEAYEQAQSRKEEELSDLIAETMERSNELKIVSAREAAEAAAAAEAARKAAGGSSSSTAKKSTNSSAQFLWPLPDQHTRISSPFENRQNPVTGKGELHNGIDLPAPARTPIYAADGGTVVIAQWRSGWGNCVTINHGNGYVTLYAHASSLNVTAGQVVNRGDVIAFVGTTGISTGNHLHFTVYIDGVAVDPLPYLK